MQTHTHIRTHTHTYTHIHANTHTHAYTQYMHTFIRASVHPCIMFIPAHQSIQPLQTDRQAGTRTDRHACIYACMLSACHASQLIYRASQNFLWLAIHHFCRASGGPSSPTHIHIHAYIHTYIHTYLLTYIHTSIHTHDACYMQIYAHAIHTGMHTCIHAYMTRMTYIHADMHESLHARVYT